MGWLWVCTFSCAHLRRGFQGRFRLSRSEVRAEALPLCKVQVWSVLAFRAHSFSSQVLSHKILLLLFVFLLLPSLVVLKVWFLE